MECSQDCRQGRDCDCGLDTDQCLTFIEQLVIVAVYTLSAVIAVAIIGFIFGVFA